MDVSQVANFATAGAALDAAADYAGVGSVWWGEIIAVLALVEGLIEKEVNGTWPVETDL